VNSAKQKLVLIKLLHTAIWIFFNLVLIYLFYAVIANRIDLWFWLGIGAFFLEFVVLLAFQWNCPLTFWARNYSDSTRHNFDIYLPEWIAQHNKTIYSILIGILILIFVYTQFLR
jgi:polyferredoxin